MWLSSNRNVFFRKRMLIIYLFFIVIGCNEFEDKPFSEKERNFPSRTFRNARVTFKDSGFIKVDLKSPLIEEYGMIDSPYTLFPKGIKLNYFNKNIDSPGYLRADWVKMIESKGFYEGRGNVILISEKGDTLKTDKLFWSSKERRVYTQDTVYIVTLTGDSVQANNGLEAKDDLTQYTLFNNQGVKFYKEGEQ